MQKPTKTAPDIEILAPAGSFDILKTAACAGADAVYAGGNRFGARAYAQNFSEEELLDAIDYMHLHGKKLYLTVNTLIKEREFHELYDYLLPFYRQGLDAVIVQDFGAMKFIKEQFPNLGIHASTQMTITHASTAKFLESYGVERVVPARELSLPEIRKISEETNLEIECFVHGALCYCYSGQCLLSSMIGGRSGNRGQCAQPCRLPWKTSSTGRPMDVISLKDLCTIDFIPELIEAGITSFKIEGRMKQPSYVETVVHMYRKYTDMYLNGCKKFRVQKEDKEALLAAYQRRGYTDGYYHHHNGRQMISLERPRPANTAGEIAAAVSASPALQEKINGKLILSPGKHAKLELCTVPVKESGSGDTGISVITEGMIVDTALKQPVSAERLEKQLRKTGNTPFVFDRLDIQLDSNVFLPIQAVNELRRTALEELEQALLASYRREIPKKLELPEKEVSGNDGLTVSVSVETIPQFQAVLENPWIERIYVEDALLLSGGVKNEQKALLLPLVKEAQQKGLAVYFAMARIFRQEAESVYEKEYTFLADTFDGALIRNLESWLFLKSNGFSGGIVSDTSLYQWNRTCQKFWQEEGLLETSAPLELNGQELRDLDTAPMELTVYGHLPVMVTAGCVKKHTGACDKKPGFSSMSDRYQKAFPVKNECLYCYNVLYNTDPVYLTGQAQEIRSLCLRGLRLQFSVESGKETRRILEEYRRVFREGADPKEPETAFTRGHFKRGVK